ncbi:LANO_0H25290g1_1 [Lachancea nothofagi CBS 11611]|uniref:LANO_0H25290g1_1 n=1 Tax=Lachancea nothofagi CBS 11611 TaxID=1266666 RepID=A0A1G4KP14_9SACH|nr:LANO_0H25290g1_1 [Lachancea nothofagi CBS 11611]
MVRKRYRSGLKGSQHGDFIKYTERRSKNGCLTCRNRRKKCDEVKPQCSGCARNMLDCNWPSPFSKEHLRNPENNEPGLHQKYSFIHVPQEELSKSYTPQPKYRIGRSAINPPQIALGLSRLPSDDLCDVKEDCRRALRRVPRYRKSKIKSLCEEVQVRDKKEKHIHVHSLTRPEDAALRFPTPICDSEIDGTGEDELHDETIENELISINHQEVAESRKYKSGTNNIAKLIQKELRSDTSEIYRDFFDLKLESYILLKESALNNSFTQSNDGASNASHPKHKDSELRRHSVQSSINSQYNGELAFQSNYSFLNGENNCAAENYHKIIESYDRGEFGGHTNTENDEALLFYTCIEKFIPNLGSQYTHPLLTACATFIPQVENNMPLKEIFLCCGATYLEWYDDAKFSPLSNSLYKSSQMLIEKHLLEDSLMDAGSWLMASFQLLCLRSKMASSGTVDDCVNCLSKSYLVLKNTVFTRNKAQNHMAAGLQNLAYEIENKFIGQSEQEKSKGSFVLQPYERMYIESFIYNYSVAILFASDISKLPNPFSIFKELSHVLKRPLYYCYFEWMNNPVLGPALDAFEILAKVSFIARLPMPLDKSSIWFQRAQQLQTMALFYTGPVLYPQLKSKNEQIFKNAKVSSLVGIIVAKSSYLLVSKILQYHDFQIQQPSIQKVRCEIFEAFSSIPLENKIWGILLWSLTITGCFSTAMPEKGHILKYILNVGEYFHNQNTIKMRSFLEDAWSRPIDKRLDILFDRKELSKISP